MVAQLGQHVLYWAASGLARTGSRRNDQLNYRNATLCEARERWCAYTIVVDRPDPGSVPIPRYPAARIKRDLQAEATTSTNPGCVDCSGLFFVAVNMLLAVP